MLEKNRKHSFNTSISSQVPYVNCIPFWGVKKKKLRLQRCGVCLQSGAMAKLFFGTC